MDSMECKLKQSLYRLKDRHMDAVLMGDDYEKENVYRMILRIEQEIADLHESQLMCAVIYNTKMNDEAEYEED